MDRSALDVIPYIAQLPEETACLWKATLLRQGISVPASLHQWKHLLDEAPRNLAPTLFVDLPPGETYQLQQIYRFPKMELRLLPDEPDLSHTLVGALGTPIPDLLTQSQIASEVTRTAQGAHIIVVLILDGLGYEDVLKWRYSNKWQWTRRPCFVDGATLTTAGMPRVVGSPTLAHRLFQQGYKQHFGFTYWERDNNDLTNALFAEFSSSQLMKVSEFAQILDRLAGMRFDTPTYVQIVRNGLDQFVHSYRERPDIRHYLRELDKSIQNLLDLLTTFQRHVRVHITADHGILWYEQQTVVAITENPRSARHVAGDFDVSDSRFARIHEPSASYTVAVGLDHTLRRRHTNEWGFHGGISSRESLVPFLTLDYRPQENLYA
jgi:hypothetical protein